MKKIFMLLATVLIVVITGCGGGGGSDPIPAPPSTLKAITVFSLAGVVGTINETGKTIAVPMPFGTDVTALVGDIYHNRRQCQSWFNSSDKRHNST